MRYTLLNVDANPKTVKGQKKGYMTAVMYLSPSDSSGKNLCPMAEIAGCAAPCLNTAGRGGMAAGNKTFTSPGGAVLPDNAVQRARLRRSALFNEDPRAFMRQLVREIRAFLSEAKFNNLTPVVRLNGLSDIRWEIVDFTADGKYYPNIFAAFPKVQFYDYTKIINRNVANIPNYHLTYSYSHRAAFLPYVERAIKHYGPDINLAVVFSIPKSRPLPETFMGRRVVDGDESDLRFLDDKNVIVGLRAKGRARKDTSGFAVPEGEERTFRIAVSSTTSAVKILQSA